MDETSYPAMIGLYIQPSQLTTGPRKKNEMKLRVENSNFFSMTKLKDRQAKYLFKISLELKNNEIIIDSASIIISDNDYDKKINFTSPFACCPHGDKNYILFVAVNDIMYLLNLKQDESKNTLLNLEVERCPE